MPPAVSVPVPALLAPDEPPAVSLVNPEGRAPLILICDHASAAIPRALGDLGLAETTRHDHVGWDIGAAAVARLLADRLDAPLVLTGYSRLVVDCNRPPGTPGSIPEVTCGITVPGNLGLDDTAREARLAALFRPYHGAVAALIDARLAAGRPPALLAIHSFTPVLNGAARPWQIGITYGADRRLSGHLLELLRRRHPQYCTGDNQPYAVTEASDYAMPVHGLGRGLLHTLIEMRNDQLRTVEGQHCLADVLGDLWGETRPLLDRLRALPSAALSSGP